MSSRFLGIDYGKRRVGVALSDDEGIIAIPLCVIKVQQATESLSRIKEICIEKKVVKVILGLPLKMNGALGPAAEEVLRFADLLRNKLALPVETWDERLSTKMVERALIDQDIRRARRKDVIDKMAAQVVLQNYLDAMNAKEGRLKNLASLPDDNCL